MSTAVPINLTIEQGTDFSVEFNLRDENGDYINLTGYTVIAKMARNYTTQTKYSLNPVIVNPVDGLIRLSMPDTGGSLVVKTGDLKSGRYVYNVYINSPAGKSDKVIDGVITVISGVL